MSTCIPCAEYSLKACPETIVVKAGLTPSTSYYWLIKTPKGKIYQRQAVTDTDGNLTIDTSIIPAGSLNAYAGSFELQIRNGINYLTVISMTLRGAPTECAQINFEDIDDTNPFNVIE